MTAAAGQVKQKNVLNIALETQRADICLALVDNGAQMDVRSLELISAFKSSSKWSRFEPVMQSVVRRTSGSASSRTSVRAASTIMRNAAEIISYSRSQSPNLRAHSPGAAPHSPDSPPRARERPRSPRVSRVAMTQSPQSPEEKSPGLDEQDFEDGEALSPSMARKVAILLKKLQQRSFGYICRCV